MRYPTLHTLPRLRQTVSAFYGCERRPQPRTGAFYDLKNMTSFAFPLLTVRPDRKRYLRGAAGTPGAYGFTPDGDLTAAAAVNGCAVFASGTTLYYHGSAVTAAPLSAAENRRIVPFGRNLFVSPDGRYVETDENGVSGVRHAGFSQTLSGAVLCYADENGQAVTVADAYPTPPSGPAEGQLWTDTSETPWVLKKYTGGAWAAQSKVYLKLGHADADRFAVPGDALEIGIMNVTFSAEVAAVLRSALLMNCAHTDVPAGTFSLTLKKPMPVLDLAIEHRNRVWGCRFGRNAKGEFVNEIYASAPGDPTVWDRFEGVSTDSFVSALGCPGPFTGAAAAGGELLFFKENYLIRVCGDTPGDFTVLATPAPGPAKGCENTVVTLNEKVYYLGADGVYVYDGALPYLISERFPLRGEAGALGAAWDGRYCLVTGVGGERRLCVYAPLLDIWHTEDDPGVRFFLPTGGGLFLLCRGADETAYGFTVIGAEGEAPDVIDPTDATVTCAFGDLPQKTWFAETGRLAPAGETGVVRGLCFRLSLGADAEFRAEIACGEDAWTPLCRVRRPDGETFSVPVNTPRCSHFRLRLSGAGDCTVYGITLLTERTGEVRGLVR